MKVDRGTYARAIVYLDVDFPSAETIERGEEFLVLECFDPIAGGYEEMLHRWVVLCGGRILITERMLTGWVTVL